VVVVFMMMASLVFVSISTSITFLISPWRRCITRLVARLVPWVISRLTSVGWILLWRGKGWRIIASWQRRVRRMTLHTPLGTLRMNILISSSARVALLGKFMGLLLGELLRLMSVHPVEAFGLDKFIDLCRCNAGEYFL
jgi:hypothetical protein